MWTLVLLGFVLLFLWFLAGFVSDHKEHEKHKFDVTTHRSYADNE